MPINKDEITKEEFLKPFVDLFLNLMKVTNDKDILTIKDFFSNLIEETEGDTNKFFLELIDISNNIVDYTSIENEEEIFNAFAYELNPFKEQLNAKLKKSENNLITFDSFKKLFEELKINLSDEYYQYLLYKMKEEEIKVEEEKKPMEQLRELRQTYPEINDVLISKSIINRMIFY